jgi:hypothetical protein
VLVLPLAAFMTVAPSTRQAAWRIAAVYLSALLTISLVLGFATRVARWQSDVTSDWDRPSVVAAYVVVGVLVLRSTVAVGIGVMLAHLAGSTWSTQALTATTPPGRSGAALARPLH